MSVERNTSSPINILASNSALVLRQIEITADATDTIPAGTVLTCPANSNKMSARTGAQSAVAILSQDITADSGTPDVGTVAYEQGIFNVDNITDDGTTGTLTSYTLANNNFFFRPYPKS